MKVAAVRETSTAQAPEAPASKELARACAEFEGVLLRQMLEASHIGDQAGPGYGPMVVDALASSVTQAGGLGLADAIARALRVPSARE